MYKLIDGKAVAADVRRRCAQAVADLKEQGVETSLAVILVGDDPASRVYVTNKEKDCAETGIRSIEHHLPADTTREALLALIAQLNADDSIHGVLCQLPLPNHLDERDVIEAIAPEKDVDCFHPANVGRLSIGGGTFLPCTPAGVVELLRFYGVDAAGKNCVVVGRSNIVGKPMSMLMLRENATVTTCHSRTRDLAAHTRQADILISAIGKAKFITADMVKPGAVVVDVGMNRDENGKLCGDVDFETVAPQCSLITPVPGGVGPMTRAMLLVNTVAAARAAAGSAT